MSEVIDIKDKKAIIKKQTCFSQLTEEECNVFTELLKEVYFKANDTIVREGDIVDSVYLIMSGTADVRHVYLKEGVTRFESIAKLGPEQAIGLNETGFYSVSGVRTATVVALTEMLTLRFSVAAFHGFALAYPHVSEVMRNYASTFLNRSQMNK